MGVLDRFEQGMERLLAGSFDRAGRGTVQPVEIASAIRNLMDENTVRLGRDRVVGNNAFQVELSPSDYAWVESIGERMLSEELANMALEHGQEQGYSFVGRVTVEFTPVETLQGGSFEVHGENRRGSVAPIGQSDSSPHHPIIEIEGRRYLLTGPVTTIGRGSDADIVVDDSGVSRVHLELRVTPRGTIVTDLDSTNGTFVEGYRVDAATLVDGNTVTLGRTSFMFWTSAEGA